MKITFRNKNLDKEYNFELTEDDDEVVLGRLNLELNSDKISRKTCKLKHTMTIDGYKVYLIGLLDPTEPAILVKYKNKMTFTDTLTIGMQIDVKTVVGLKYMNVDNDNIEFDLSIEGLEEDDVEIENNIENIEPGNSDEKVFREGCQYMENCYRKNPAHRKEFSHPGDEDWLQGECEYGTNCYRKNKAHQARFTHTKRQVRNQAKRVKYDDSEDQRSI